MSESKLILPTDESGVANLEIKRMQSKLDDKPAEIEMNGYMSVRQSQTAVKFLKRVIDEIESGQVRSLALIWFKPKNDIKLPEAEVLFSVRPEDLAVVDGAFHEAFNYAMNEESKEDSPD